MLPDDRRRHELVAGYLISEPPASFRHGDVSAEIFARLAEFVRQKNLGRVVSTETGFLLARAPDTVRAPDVAFVSQARIGHAGPFHGFFPGPPGPGCRGPFAHGTARRRPCQGCRLSGGGQPARLGRRSPGQTGDGLPLAARPDQTRRGRDSGRRGRLAGLPRACGRALPGLSAGQRGERPGFAADRDFLK